MPPDDQILVATDLHRSFRAGLGRGRVSAVDGVSLSVAAGESLGIVGESGCGKSTLARMLVGLERPDAGSITVAGHDLAAARGRQRRALRRRIQMVFQDPYTSLDPRLTVGDIVAEPLTVHRTTGRAGRAGKVIELLDLVGLPADVVSRYPHQFSGGQRQRIGIARALALEPSVLVCDEPVSALDMSVQAQVVNLLRDLQERTGVALVFIAHDLSVVRHVCDRVAVMYLGRLAESGDTDAVYDAPTHPYTQALLAAAPAIGRRRTARPPAGEPPSPIAPRPAAASTPAARSPPAPATPTDPTCVPSRSRSRARTWSPAITPSRPSPPRPPEPGSARTARPARCRGGQPRRRPAGADGCQRRWHGLRRPAALAPATGANAAGPSSPGRPDGAPAGCERGHPAVPGVTHGGQAADMTKMLNRGDVLIERIYFGGALCQVIPARVLRHDADELVVWVAGGTPVLRRRGVSGRALRDVPRDQWPTDLQPAEWTGSGVLRRYLPGADHSVWWFFADGGPSGPDSFAGWYVNLERHELWPDGAGIDVVDQELDGWVTPDHAWQWKDEESFAAKIGDPGFFTAAEAALVRAEGSGSSRSPSGPASRSTVPGATFAPIRPGRCPTFRQPTSGAGRPPCASAPRTGRWPPASTRVRPGTGHRCPIEGVSSRPRPVWQNGPLNRRATGALYPVRRQSTCLHGSVVVDHAPRGRRAAARGAFRHRSEHNRGSTHPAQAAGEDSQPAVPHRGGRRPHQARRPRHRGGRQVPPEGGPLVHRGQLRPGAVLAVRRCAAERARAGDPVPHR
ncbi:hypothetical protein Athai_22940 [Actinocatenispora thailandica]|uniref:ABC transporter domain-containing protein n=1 Tax=Actinocatenispora thailandica TaxID=227318 RepID=A0A7R7HWI6_9ACTN|nr:hypothetical protein Athai_22940 [Actinocatenispora thailandica]